jgi:hypothetical protein
LRFLQRIETKNRRQPVASFRLPIIVLQSLQAPKQIGFLRLMFAVLQ